jgi:hypothetical protein
MGKRNWVSFNINTSSITKAILKLKILIQSVQFSFNVNLVLHNSDDRFQVKTYFGFQVYFQMQIIKLDT